MGCDFVQLPGGGTAIVCSRGRRGPQKCACGSKATRLCDHPTGSVRGTCSKPICGACAVSVGPDRDLCAEHAPRPAQTDLCARCRHPFGDHALVHPWGCLAVCSCRGFVRLRVTSTARTPQQEAEARGRADALPSSSKPAGQRVAAPGEPSPTVLLVEGRKPERVGPPGSLRRGRRGR